jgi:hypothetical protein
MPQQPANFGDPSFEPTDEQLQELSREAFADVTARRNAAAVRLRARIALLRKAALARVKADWGTGDT